MRRFSPPLHLRYLATASASASGEASVMSSRSPHSGGRTEVIRTHPSGERTGDAVRTVRSESHSGWRRGSTSIYGSSQPRPFGFGHRQSIHQFHQASANYQNDQYFGRPSPSYQNQRPQQPFNQYNQRHQPRSRPPDHRSWEYAKIAPPPNFEKFIVLSYNILADCLAIEHRSKLYFHIPEYMMDWQWRKKNIMFELGLWSADIMCFQEVDRFQDLEEELKHKGYSGIWKMRTGNAVDGCAIFWRVSRFKLLYEESIEFRDHQLRDNVAQICVFELRQKSQNATDSLTRSAVSYKVVVCNIHVLYNPKRGEIKLGQVRRLLDKAHATSKSWNDAPVVLCGDFNCTPKSPLYNFLSQQKLDLSQVDRDKVSGQASAEIYPSRHLTTGVHTVDGAGRARSTIESKEVDAQGFHSVSGSSLQSETEGTIHDREMIMETKQTGEDAKGSDFESLAPDTLTEQSRELMNERRSSVTCTADLLTSPAEPEFELDDKIANLSLEELDETPASEKTNEVDETISSPLCDSVDVPADSGELLSSDKDEDDPSPPKDGASEFRGDTVTTYNPSLWTPSDIGIASGSEDSTCLEHPLKLRSTYTEVEDRSGMRDSNSEPIVTSYNRRFLGTVDYIWRSEGLQTVRVLAPIPKHVMQQRRGFPTKKWGSDHIALASELAFTRNGSN